MAALVEAEAAAAAAASSGSCTAIAGSASSAAVAVRGVARASSIPSSAAVPMLPCDCVWSPAFFVALHREAPNDREQC